ncbi:MAG: hypothetical protein ACYC1C_00355 [Chloroflexota bacterium]
MGYAVTQHRFGVQARGSVISIFLGAGFSLVGGVPLAGRLLDEQPAVDRITRQQLVERVLADWREWRARNAGTPEEYLAALELRRGRAWADVVWYIGLAIALRTARVRPVGTHLEVTSHSLNRASRIQVHERFWDVVFTSPHAGGVSVITTNYDILCERGLRVSPRPRIHRLGFNYGVPGEVLKGGGYPSYTHIRPVAVTGSVPLLKLHGSVSWSLRNGVLERYHDCRPAIRGDAAIVAPTTEKTIPNFLSGSWASAETHLSNAAKWIVVGYSFPLYDIAISDLFRRAGAGGQEVHVFDPDPNPASRVKSLLPHSHVVHHPGLPEGMKDLEEVLGERV